jgi:hypothetical protein
MKKNITLKKEKRKQVNLNQFFKPDLTFKTHNSLNIKFKFN